MRFDDFYESIDVAKYGKLFHGTSKLQYDKIVQDDFNVSDFFIGENRENITDHYAEKQAIKDKSDPVTIVLDAKELFKLGVEQDIHFDDEVQLGQYVISGNIKDAILKVLMIDEDGEENEI